MYPVRLGRVSNFRFEKFSNGTASISTTVRPHKKACLSRRNDGIKKIEAQDAKEKQKLPMPGFVVSS